MLKKPEDEAALSPLLLEASACEVTIDFAGGLSLETINLMRTEDCRFSPDGTVLAVAGYVANTINLFRIRYSRSGGRLAVVITGMLRLSHPSLSHPHGIDFIDSRTLVVANRTGKLLVLKLPRAKFDGQTLEARLVLESVRANKALAMRSPGSVAVVSKGWLHYSVLVCLNYRHCIVRQNIRRGWRGHKVTTSRVILREGLSIPDGVTVCRDTGLMAISNHNEHAIRVYASFQNVKRKTSPGGRLLGIDYPHGLRFFDQGRSVLAADAGQPFVHLWRDPEARWQGDKVSAASIRVMSESVFLRGRHNAQEGGPKGIDIHPSREFFVVTSEHQSLCAFDLPAMMRFVRHVETPARTKAAS